MIETPSVRWEYLSWKDSGEPIANIDMKHWIQVLVKLSAVVLGIPLLILVLIMGFIFISDFPFTDEIAATATTKNGTKLYLTQTRDGPYLSYSHDLYSKQPGSKWRWYVLDHEEARWRNVRIVIDEGAQKAAIYRGSNWVGEFNFRTQYMDKPTWSSSGDEIAPDSWSVDQVFEK